jgi:hypothetical protein
VLENLVLEPTTIRLPAGQPQPDLTSYRESVGHLVDELAGCTGPEHAGRAEAILTDRVTRPELLAVLAATPAGTAGAVDRLLREVREYRPSPRSSAVDLVALIRIYLYAQIDAMWWGHTPPYLTDADLHGSPDLVDLEALRRNGRLGFRYRRQATTLLARATRAAQRRIRPDHTPRTAGLRFTRTRPEAVALLNQLSTRFARLAPPGTPPIWVTSLARSMVHQHHLRTLGYAALLPSSHCVGYAMDIEMAWFRRFGAFQALQTLLLERQALGEVNVIDEGQAWHVCVSPSAAGRLRRDFDTQLDPGMAG